MESNKIDRFLQCTTGNDAVTNIRFKGRAAVTGLFIRGKDYEELKSKNFWRIVHLSQLKQWLATHDISLSRIFNGASFTSLTTTKL